MHTAPERGTPPPAPSPAELRRKVDLLQSYLVSSIGDVRAEDLARLYAEYEAVRTALNQAWSTQRQKYTETPAKP